MNSENPLLHPALHPDFPSIQPAHIAPAIDACMQHTRAQLDAMLASKTPRDFESVLGLSEALDEALDRAFAPVSHLHNVMDTPELRVAYTEAIERITDFQTELGQRRDLFEAVQTVRARDDFEQLPRAAKTLVEHTLRDFKLSGVALEEPARSRFRAIATELSRLSTEFEQAVLDATDAWFETISDAAQLQGVPDSAMAYLAQSAQEAGVEGWRVTLKQPSYVAIMTYANDRGLRERVYTAYATRASDAGPHAGQFDNGARIEQILALRHEAAQLLGFANAAEESLVTKMAPSVDRVLAFLHDLAARAKPGAERDLSELRDFAARELQLSELQPWDLAFASEKLKQARYQLSDEDLKPYFPLDAVLQGLFKVAGELFGVQFVERQGIPTWHADVRYFDVLDRQQISIAGMYLDLFARTAKRGGAWMDVCRTRCVRDHQVQLPIAYLTCNFTPPTPVQPSLLTHDDVVTMFHEFGHGLHHMLTEQSLPSVSGISGVEWDAVELPSQFMENFCWTRDALDAFARHWQSGERIPNALFKRMMAAKNFQAGMFLVRQLEFALFDLRIHREFDPNQGARFMAILDEVRREVAVVQPPPWHRFPHSFGHIFAGGYAAGYYSYLWAEVLSADAFSAFEQASVFDQATGERYRTNILAVGGSRPALESFVAFRGREPEPQALLKSYGLAA